MISFRTPEEFFTYEEIKNSAYKRTIVFFDVVKDDTVVTYGEDKILSFKTSHSLMGDNFDIGNAAMSSFEAELINVTPQEIPKFSRIEVWVQYTNGVKATTKIPRGVFYTKKPVYNEESKVLSISGYDEMFKLDVNPFKNVSISTWNSPTMRNVVRKLIFGTNASTIAMDWNGIDGFVVNTDFVRGYPTIPVPSIPTDLTIREILQEIAIYGQGNWVIIPDYNPINNSRQVSTLALIPIEIEAGDYIQDLERSVLSYQKEESIGKVKLARVFYGYDEDGNVLYKESTSSVGSRDVEYAVTLNTTESVIETLASNIVSEFNLCEVANPFVADGCELDPLATVGDTIVINDIESIIGSMDINYNRSLQSSIAMQNVAETDDFPYQTQMEKMQERINQKVGYKQLKTSGSVSINGSNIHAGTITLGGDNNEDGQMAIYDATGKLIGQWSKDGIRIYDDSNSELWDDGATFKVLKSPDIANYGTIVGCSGADADHVTPYLVLRSKSGTETKLLTMKSGNIMMQDSDLNFGSYRIDSIQFQKNSNLSKITAETDGNIKINDVIPYDSYASQEIPVGYWINGKKIYRKVETFTSVASGYSARGVVPSNLETLVSLRGIGNNSVPIPYAQDNAQIGLWIEGGTYHIYNSWGVNSIVVIIEYTKTTD